MAVFVGVFIFTLVVVGLVCLIIGAKSYLVPAGNVKILVNEQKEISVPQGGKLMGALADGGIFVSSACGGGGTCAQCKVKVLDGGGEILLFQSLADGFANTLEEFLAVAARRARCYRSRTRRHDSSHSCRGTLRWTDATLQVPLMCAR